MFKFASESTTHGVNFIFGENRTKFVRVLWIFLFIASLCGFSYYFKLSYTKWSVAPDITIKITEKVSREFPMPAFTICPMRFSRTDQSDYRKFSNARTEQNFFNASLSECEYLFANFNWCELSYTQKYMESFCKEHYTKLEEVNILEVVNRSAFHNEDLLRKTIAHNFTRVLTKYGVCFSYNLQDYSAIFSENIHDDFKCYKNQEHPEIEWNVERGYFSKNSTYPENASIKQLKFAAMMNPLDENNYCYVKSVLVSLHLPNEMPNEHTQISFSTYGSQTAIDIFLKSHRTNENLRSYSPDIRKCYFDGELKLELFNTYKVSHCLVECKTNVMIKACGCVLFNMPRNKTTRVCRLSDMKCVNSKESIMQEEDQLACGCLPPCNDIKYSFITNEIKMDPSFYELDQNNSLATMWIIELSSYTVEEIENFLTYTLENFVADVGGLLGLFLGCSLLSIVEVFYFLFTILSKALKNRNGKQANKILTTEDMKNIFLMFDGKLKDYQTQNDESFKQLFASMERLERSLVIAEDDEVNLSEVQD